MKGRHRWRNAITLSQCGDSVETFIELGVKSILSSPHPPNCISSVLWSSSAYITKSSKTSQSASEISPDSSITSSVSLILRCNSYFVGITLKPKTMVELFLRENQVEVY